MFLLFWKVTSIACFVSIAYCGVIQLSNENVGKVQISEERFSTCPNENSMVPVYLPHSENCNKFYICDDGTPHLHTCPPGLHFNIKNNACDFPKNAGCDIGSETKEIGRINEESLGSCPTEDSEIPIYFPHPNDCSKFYVCNSGTPYLKNCQTGLHFNPKINTCDYPADVKCDKSSGVKVKESIKEKLSTCPTENSEHPVYLPHPDDCNKFYICDSGTQQLKACQPGLHFNPSIKTCDYPQNAGCDKSSEKKGRVRDESHDSCPMENSEIPVIIPHQNDCRKFYICDSGTPHLKSCQQGLHFNPKINACDYPDNAGCDKSSITKGKGKIGDGSLDSCPVENSEIPVLLPYPKDCRKFYICNSGTPHLKSCQPGLHFNPKLSACDYPENAGCDKNSEAKERGRMIDESLGSCPAENSEIPVLLPHLNDCRKFYICDSGTPHLKICQRGLHFNPKIGACDYPITAGCDKNLITKGKGKIGDETFDSCPVENSEISVLFPHPKDCSKFYICNSGTPHLKSCQPGLHFNPKLNTCDYPDNAGCDKTSGTKEKERIKEKLSPCPDENSDPPVYLPHPSDCKKFYICDNGTPQLKICQPSLHFNPKINACDYPKNAGCNKNVAMKSGKKFYSDNLISCPDDNSLDKPIFHRHPTDCDKFYICHQGMAILTICPTGLKFNEKTNVCDFSENVVCEIQTNSLAAVPVHAVGVSSPFCPPVNGKLPIFFRHPNNCTVYYMCGNGLAYEFTCPSRLHFNLRKRVCDYEKNSKCQINPSV